MHPDVELLQRFLDGELAPQPAVALRAHFEICPDCRARAAAAQNEQQEVDALLGKLDSAVHDGIDPDTWIRRAEAARSHPSRRWAAGILLTLAAAAGAAALPGSPVRAWIADRLEARPPRPASTDTGAEPPAAAPAARGVGVTPGPNLVIVFVAQQPTGYANVSFSDTGEVHVSTTASQAGFDTESEDVLRIDNRGLTADFDVLIPRTANHVEIHIGSVQVFLKQGQRITTAAPVRPDGTYSLDLNRR